MRTQFKVHDLALEQDTKGEQRQHIATTVHAMPILPDDRDDAA